MTASVFCFFLALQFQSATIAQVQPSEEHEEQEEDTVAWVNAAVGRIFWDFLREPYWAEVVSKKIQMKLSKIRVSPAPIFSPRDYYKEIHAHLNLNVDEWRPDFVCCE